MSTTVRPDGGDRLPGWTLLALAPFAVLAACAVYLQVHWNEIPERFPVHWNAHGPNGWSTRTFLGVYSSLIFGAGLSALILAFGLVSYRASGRSRGGATMLRVMVGLSCFLGLIFGGVGLLPLGMPPVILIAAAPLGGLAVLGILLVTASGGNEPEDNGGNASRVPLFVPKKVGWGYTFNFANRYSWALLGMLFGGLTVLIAFLLWAQK